MQSRAIEPVSRQTLVQFRYLKGEHRAARRRVTTKLCAQRGEIVGVRPIGRGKGDRHGNRTTQMFPICSFELRPWSSVASTNDALSAVLIWDGLPKALASRRLAMPSAILREERDTDHENRAKGW